MTDIELNPDISALPIDDQSVRLYTGLPASNEDIKIASLVGEPDAALHLITENKSLVPIAKLRYKPDMIDDHLVILPSVEINPNLRPRLGDIKYGGVELVMKQKPFIVKDKRGEPLIINDHLVVDQVTVREVVDGATYQLQPGGWVEIVAAPLPMSQNPIHKL